MEKFAAKVNSAKAFVQKHRTAITVVATATPLIALQLRSQKIHNEFLKEHDLFDEFYKMDELEEA